MTVHGDRDGIGSSVAIENGMTRDQVFCSRVLRYRPSRGPDFWSEENVQEVVDLWKLSPDTEHKLRELGKRVADVDHFKNDPHILARFLHGPWGQKEAESMFRRMIEWRIENKVDTILDDYIPPQLLLDAVPSAILKDFDREGDPVYIERGGAVDPTGLLKVFSFEELIRYGIWTRERNTNGIWINDYERQQGRRIRSITIIYDLKGLSSRHMNPRAIEHFKEIMRITQCYFPNPIKRMIIIRTPKFFQILWSVIKHLFPARARAKMIFLGSHYLEVLDKYVDINCLPPSIYEGGTGEAAPGMMQNFDGMATIPESLRDCNDEPVSYYMSKQSTAETDEESLSSTGSFSVGSGVNGKVLVRGSWKKRSDGNVEVAQVPMNS